MTQQKSKNKFRGKTYDGEWIYGGHTYDEEGNPLIGYVIFDNGIYEFFGNYVIPATVCQFIEIHDITGKEIYEKHIVRWAKDIISVIEWDDEEIGYSLVSKHTIFSLHNDGAISDVAILGNTYDNPELLEKNN